MDVRDTLREDHQRLLDLANHIPEADDPAQARKLFHQLKEALTRHERAEEQVVYAALSDLGENRALRRAHEGSVEHELADRLLQQCTRGRADAPIWKARMKVLSQLLERHVQAEESEAFELLGKHFDSDDLAKMGERFEEHKERVRLTSPRSNGPLSQTGL